mmetsp:Transcript_18536/g.35234  ORF Transcript_18536/g.35234 Transcript_18536/m.35234 type:complete len:98 (-) Transcript_18536:174-467(-)
MLRGDTPLRNQTKNAAVFPSGDLPRRIRREAEFGVGNSYKIKKKKLSAASKCAHGNNAGKRKYSAAQDLVEIKHLGTASCLFHLSPSALREYPVDFD